MVTIIAAQWHLVASAPPARKKSRVRSAPIDKLRVDAWGEKLLHMILGATMTQVALCRLFIRENIADRQRLLTFLEEQTSSDEASLPLIRFSRRSRLRRSQIFQSPPHDRSCVRFGKCLIAPRIAARRPVPR
jgi:hypothetical protein